MTDLIDRQEALEGLYDVFFDDELSAAYPKEADKVLDVIRKLPSAQPEVIRCKDCKWCEDADGSTCKNPASWVVATDCDFGCVLAERKENG